MNCEIRRKGTWRNLCSCEAKPPSVSLAGASVDENTEKEEKKNSHLVLAYWSQVGENGKLSTDVVVAAETETQTLTRAKCFERRNIRHLQETQERAAALSSCQAHCANGNDLCHHWTGKQEKQPLVEPERWELAFTTELFPRVSSPFVRGCQQCSVNSGSLVWRKHCNVDVCSRVKEARCQSGVAAQTWSPQASSLVISAIWHIKWEVDWTR